MLEQDQIALEETLRGILFRIITEASTLYSREQLSRLQMRLHNYSNNVELAMLIDSSLTDYIAKVKSKLTPETEEDYEKLEKLLQKAQQDNRVGYKNMQLYRKQCLELEEEVRQLQMQVVDLMDSNFILRQKMKRQGDSLEAEIQSIKRSLPKKNNKLASRQPSPPLIKFTYPIDRMNTKKSLDRKFTTRESSVNISTKPKKRRRVNSSKPYHTRQYVH